MHGAFKIYGADKTGQHLLEKSTPSEHALEHLLRHLTFAFVTSGEQMTKAEGRLARSST